jgi:polyhydroxyalkanoate synthesis regulator phasin
MATVEQMEKKRTRQVEEILAATNYLKTAFMEAEIHYLKQQIAELSGQIAELKNILTAPAPAMAVPVDKTRRTKK